MVPAHHTLQLRYKRSYYKFSNNFIDTDSSDLVTYANGCYEHYKYHECLLCCNKLLKPNALEQGDKDQIQVLKCKALFKIFQTEYHLLQNERELLTSGEFHQKEKSCYDKLREMIGPLGAALDKNSIDDEAYACLDHGMIHVIRGTNELNKFRRCMLCLKQRDDLKRSHIVPKSILEVFRSGFVQHQGNKGLIVAGVQSSKAQIYHSEKTITKFMLCGDCEALLNQNGEHDFLNKFFMKIYDPSISEALTVGKSLPYESWLYHFCIGFLFRVIAGFIGIPNVMNHHEVYSFFTKCRKFLLDRSNVSSFPKVYLLANPTKIPHEYRNEWNHEALLEPAFFHCPKIRLSNGNTCHFPEAHFLMAHLGILNMIVTFSPADDVSMPEQFVVNPNAGMYILPPEEGRLEFLPVGIKTTFTIISENIKEDMKEFFFRREKPFPPVAPKTADKALQDTVGLVEAINSDFNQLMESNANYLPSNFHVDKVTKTFQLPPEYRLLVHFTMWVQVLASNFTYFVGIFNSQQPFVIIYQSSVSETKCFGCLVSEDDLKVTKYISSIQFTKNSSIGQKLDAITSTLGDILPILLRTKGFKDLKMLINYCKHRYVPAFIRHISSIKFVLL